MITVEKVRSELNTLDAPRETVEFVENGIMAIAPNINLEGIFNARREYIKANPETAGWTTHPSVVLNAVTDKNLRGLSLKGVRSLRDNLWKILGAEPSETLRVLWEIFGLVEHATEEAKTGVSSYSEGCPLMREEYDPNEWRVLLRIIWRKVRKVLRVSP